MPVTVTFAVLLEHFLAVSRHLLKDKMSEIGPGVHSVHLQRIDGDRRKSEANGVVLIVFITPVRSDICHSANVDAEGEADLKELLVESLHSSARQSVHAL